MSASSREWDDSVIAAADVLVEREGVDGAIAELNERRQDLEQNGRASEALAYVKRYYSDGDQS